MHITNLSKFVQLHCNLLALKIIRSEPTIRLTYDEVNIRLFGCNEPMLLYLNVVTKPFFDDIYLHCLGTLYRKQNLTTAG